MRNEICNETNSAVKKSETKKNQKKTSSFKEFFPTHKIIKAVALTLPLAVIGHFSYSAYTYKNTQNFDGFNFLALTAPTVQAQDKPLDFNQLTLISSPQTATEAHTMERDNTRVSYTYDLLNRHTAFHSEGKDDGTERVQVSHIVSSASAKDPSAIETKLVNWFFAPKTENLDADVRKEIAAVKTTGTQSNANSNEFSATNLQFNYLTLNHIESFAPQAFSNYDLANTYAQQKKVKAMQRTALYIAQNYEVDLNKSEKIVLEVYKHSNLQNLPPSLLLSVIEAESTFQADSVSHKAAKGLMQVIPKYHPEEMRVISSKKLALSSIEGGIEVGSKVLRKYLDLAKGNLSLALLMYNGSTADPSKKYARKVLSKVSQYEVVAQK